MPAPERLANVEDASKKDLVAYLQQHASSAFLKEHSLAGKLDSIAKGKKKPQLVAAYNALFETEAFRDEAEEADAAAALLEQTKLDEQNAAEAAAETEAAAAQSAEDDTPKYTKTVLKKGNKVSFPKDKQTVHVFYTGRLEDGTIFDSNEVDTPQRKIKSKQALRFKLGANRVIKGWEEALKTMSCGERARIVVQPEWAYGKKGLADIIPPNATLTFDMELSRIE